MTVWANGTGGTALKFMTAPVNFEVGQQTKLLKAKDGTLIRYEVIYIDLNGTATASNMTAADGSFTYRRHFDLGEETIVYNVQAVFNGTDDQPASHRVSLAVDKAKVCLCLRVFEENGEVYA
jgi:hypothetical protein